MRVYRARLFAAVIIGGLLLTALAGCEALSDMPAPTVTPSPTIFIMPASPTVDPRLPTIAGDPGAFVSEFTPGAPPLVGGATVTPPPLATQANLALQFEMQDGLILSALYYVSAVRPAPIVILLNGQADDWEDLAPAIRAAGFHALAVDVRLNNPAQAVQDMQIVVDRALALPNVQKDRVILVGAGVSADVALAACAIRADCAAVAGISPGPAGVGSVARMAAARIFLAAARADPLSDGAALDTLARNTQPRITVKLYEGDAHSLVLLFDQPELAQALVRWLAG